ncbi:replication initiation protein [Siphonobacter curvatus]|uniref:Initiator RepB protein n=1 Tax=Siphonobacter curvatus TaxID=2094562 RepID=A0A2S7IG68_9BACT|nr:replication initiation protein [Siphonobacter curvatus]PQA54410.1 initiator RepB protein [Siphonobacter curvatus]
MNAQIEIYQDNFLTQARYEMTETERNILYMVIAQVRPDDSPMKVYQVSIKEIAKIMGSEEIKFEAYKNATARIVTRLVQGYLPNGDFLQTTFAASAKYKKGTGIIEIALSQEIRPFYVDLKERFTKIQLQAAISLQSIYAKRIYELLCMYKNMKNKTFRRKLVDLKLMLGVMDTKTGKDKYPVWTQFQRDVLEVASREINGHTDLTFTFTPILGDRPGRGRKPVEQVEFEVSYITPNVIDFSPLMDRLLNRFKLRQDQAEEVIESFPIEKINKILYDIEVRMANNEIKNVGSYTAKSFGL